MFVLLVKNVEPWTWMFNKTRPVTNTWKFTKTIWVRTKQLNNYLDSYCIAYAFQDGWQNECRYNDVQTSRVELHSLHVRYTPWRLLLWGSGSDAWTKSEGIHQDGHLLPREVNKERIRQCDEGVQTFRKSKFYPVLYNGHVDLFCVL